MTLNDIKLKRTVAGLGDKLPKKNASNESGGSLGESVTVQYDVDADGNYTNPRVVEEGKEHKTPEFIRHCVAAITSDPKKLAKVQEKKDGSPFGICTAQYKKDKRALAAKHSRGDHHSSADYEKALATLRNEADELRAARPSRTNILFESQDTEPKKDGRRTVRYTPR